MLQEEASDLLFACLPIGAMGKGSDLAQASGLPCFRARRQWPVIGTDITAFAAQLPATAGCAPRSSSPRKSRTRWPYVNSPRSPNAGRRPRLQGEGEARGALVGDSREASAHDPRARRTSRNHPEEGGRSFHREAHGVGPGASRYLRPLLVREIGGRFELVPWISRPRQLDRSGLSGEEE